MKLRPDYYGYLFTSVYEGSKRVRLYAHRSVMAAFVGPRPEGVVTRHLDGDPSNNELSNLQYGTPNENALDSVAHGTHVAARRTHCPVGHQYDEGNTRMYQGRRHCRACARIRSKLKHAKSAYAAIRRWAEENGIPVHPRGALPLEVRRMYAEAHDSGERGAA